ncbi:hypothetical protein LJ737_04295 [Hymenobacter sp. 15J16-1T3B]|uniref:hypothetical protein n=1 Tax=Hymenobacter sp. 15J16-1T3B TaxID=2886941 RepID=UPI001D111D2B|nr:hypothetical protein [Hymenobacter sp. 15J16-1T3B]MCC3156443.1 hypothetical protein [Hymenobacter sp. 15J16-1T3B]
MARLSQQQVQALLKAPANGADIAACVRHEERIRLHAVPCVDGDQPPVGLKQLLKRWEARLPLDKYQKMLDHLEWPLATLEIVDAVFTGLSRVFEAQDGLVQVELATPELETDFEQFRTDQREDAFWAGEAFRAVRQAPHSLLVVDMATEQTTRYPEPYVFVLNVASVIDVELRTDSSCEYLLFELPSRQEGATVIERAAAYDDDFYRICEKRTDEDEWRVVLENAHILGSCPARMLWSEPLSGATALPRRGPLTKQLAQLDRFVWWDTAIEYYESYGVFPVWWSFEEKCDYQTPDGAHCNGGMVPYLKATTMLEGREVPIYGERECPVCKARKLIGPGTEVQVPAPSKDLPDTRNPIGTVSADPEVLRYIQERQQARMQQIITACLGSDTEPQNAQAKNRDQVAAGFESKTDVLTWFKRPFEAARQWALQVRGTLRYGALMRSAYVNLGEQWYLKTPEQLSAQEAEARKAGRPVYELSQARDQRYQTEYRTNPALLDRMRILSDLEPFPEYSLEQIGTLLEQQPAVFGAVFTPQLVALKADFGRYLTRFESEQLPVTRFASRQPYHLKLEAITQILLSYVPPIPNGQGGQAPENRPAGTAA